MENKTKVNRLDYTSKKIVVDNNNIDDYSFMSNRRNLRKGHVQKLKLALKRGECFKEFSVNYRNGKKYLLDGNHRMAAIQQYIEETGNAVEIKEDQYELNPEEEILKFCEINNNIKTGSDDLINLYQDEPFVKSLLKIPCVSVYGTTQRPMKIRPLMAAYFLAITPKHQTAFLSPLAMIQKIKLSTNEDLKVIRAFLRDYENIFGTLTKNNMWIRTTLLTAMFRIWYHNRNIPYEVMEKKFRSLMGSSVAIEHAGMGGVDSSFKCAVKFVDMLNNIKRPIGTFMLEMEQQTLEV